MKYLSRSAATDIDLVRAHAGRTMAAVNQVTGVIRAIEYQGTYVKSPSPPGSNGPEFVVYIDEGSLFRRPDRHRHQSHRDGRTSTKRICSAD